MIIRIRINKFYSLQKLDIYEKDFGRILHAFPVLPIVMCHYVSTGRINSGSGPTNTHHIASRSSQSSI